MSQFDSYISLVGPIAPLSHDEEKALIIKAQAGDQYARTKLIKSNILYVAKVANRYSFLGEPDDLMSWGCAGLNEAINRFDVSCNYKLITYATFLIRYYIQKGDKDKSVECKISLDDYLSNDSDNTRLEKLSSEKSLNPEQEFINSELHDRLEAFLSGLSERDATIVKARAGYGYEKPASLREIGKIVGLTKGGVHEVGIKVAKKARNTKEGILLEDFLVA